MNRAYISTADFRAPFDQISVQGLGAFDEAQQKPTQHQYLTTAWFRAPYRFGYFQDNDLMGVPPDIEPVTTAEVSRYLNGGEAPSALSRDWRTPFNQVPFWAYLGLGAFFSVLAYKRYQKFKKTGA